MKVKVVNVKGVKNLVMRWTCSQTGRQIQRSAKTTKRHEAIRLAAKLEGELERGTYFKPNNITWREFRDLFEELRVPNFRIATARSYDHTFNRFEKLMGVHRLSQLDTLTIARFQSRLSQSGSADATIAKHLRQLKAALKWARSIDLINRVPEFNPPKAGRHQRVMKGRPVTDVEFQKMLDVVENVVGAESADSWREFLNGVLLSGLRLGEALALTWHRSADIYVDYTSGEYPAFRISASKDKGGRSRVLPMVPDFALFLDQIGRKDEGYVFNLGRVETGRKGKSIRSIDWTSKVVSRIGRKAGVITSDEGAKIKYASTHDLRRSFGVKWSKRVFPQMLQQLMRHSNIETTQRYYVGEDADRVAEELWRGVDAGARYKRAG